jgi:acyl-CoA thioesterase
VGSATFIMPITGWLQIPPGLMTAGGVAILADGPLGWAIQSALPPATGYATTELSVNMVRRVPDEGQLVARGRLVHLGRRLGLSEVFVTDDAGRLIAHGTSRCVIFPPAADVPAPPRDVADAGDHDDGWIAPFLRPVRGAVLGQEIFATRTGLELMRGLVSGELPLPPAARLLAVVC